MAAHTICTLFVLTVFALQPITVFCKFDFSSRFPPIIPESAHELEILNAFKEELENSHEIEPPATGAANELEMFSVLKDELQQLRMELTKSFVEQQTRRKRDASHASGSFSIKVTIDEKVKSAGEQFRHKITSIGHSTAIYQSSTIVFQRDGIHRLERSSATSSSELVKVGTWELEKDDKILNSFEWEDKLFILSTNERRGYSQIFTMHIRPGSVDSPISTQRIRNQGRATSAQFFTHGNTLYLVMTVDNDARTLTSSPVFRWTHTYMDQIHEIQTRGATACDAFTIGQFKYLAIAQTQDADGNTEVGTILVRLHANGEVEKFQLLWSNGPSTLKYLPFLKEHFLIVGQPEESLVYWFGGFDFLQWQSLDGLSGSNLFLDSFVWQGEPILLAATEKQVAFYTRARAGSSANAASSKLKRTSTIFTAKSSERIVEAKLLQMSKTSVPSLALTLQTGSASTLEIIPLEISSEEIPESQIKESEDKLQKCVNVMEKLLLRDEEGVTLFQNEGPHVLKRQEVATFSGRITSTGKVSVESTNGKSQSNLGSVTIKPQFEDVEDACDYPPTKTLALIESQVAHLEENVQGRLNNVVRKSHAGEITGDLTFKKSLKINTLNSDSNLNLRTLNGIEWSSLENKVLRQNTTKSQTITGKWDVENLEAVSVQSTRKTPQSFLLQKCSKGETQIIQGDVEFEKNVVAEKLQIAALATINEIKFANIALRSVNNEVGGFKHADSIHGEEGLEIEKLNDINLSAWYDAVLKIDGTERQQMDGKITFENEMSAATAQIELLNGRSWNSFTESVLLDTGDQTIQGDLSLSNLRIAHLRAETINDKELSGILSTSSDQHITSEFNIESLKIEKSLNRLGLDGIDEGFMINGISLLDAVLFREDTTINGAVELEDADIEELQTTSGVTINGLDVGEAVQLRKKHIYFTNNPADVIQLRGEIKATNLISDTLNGMAFDSIKDMYWSSTNENEIQVDFDLSRARGVVVGRDMRTATLNGLHLESDVVTIDNDEIIELELEFETSTTVQSHVLMDDEVEVNEIDFSEWAKKVVRTIDKGRRIAGKKTFEDSLELENGMSVQMINGIALETDVVRLKSSDDVQSQFVQGLKSFDEIIAQDVTKSSSDVAVDGTVNGHDLIQLSNYSVYKNGDTVSITSDLVFEKLVRVGDIVADEINGLKVNEVVSQAINLGEAQDLDVSLLINGGSLKCTADSNVVQINNVLLHEYLPKIVNKHNVEEISGAKEFHGEFQVTGELDCENVNGVSFKEIEEFGFSKTKDQIISGKYVIEQAQIGNLVTENIGGILVSDFVRIDEHNKINVPVTFTKNVNVNEALTVEGLLNDYNIESLSDDLKTLKGNRQFREITVDGNLSWEISHEEFERLGHLFSNVVRTDEPQTLTQEITFEEDIETGSIRSEKGINGIDFAEIAKDAVDVDDRNLEFSGKITFTSDVEISKDGLDIETLQIEEVDGLNLAEFEEKVVRKNTNVVIKGTKTFERGVSVKHLRVSGTIDEVNPVDIVLIDDARKIDQLIINEVVKVNGDLDFNNLDDVELEAVLRDRVTSDGDHIVRGDITFENDLHVHGCNAKSINGIDLSDVLLSNSDTVQTISGSKTFSEILVESQLEHAPINGISFDEIDTKVLRRDRNETIHRPVVFIGTIHVQDSINVDVHLNDHTFENLAGSFTEKLVQISETVAIDDAKIGTALSLIEQLQDNLDKMPGWFDFLELGEVLAGSSSRVELVEAQNGDLKLMLHEATDGTRCGLPESCSARSVHGFTVDQHSLKIRKSDINDCRGIFQVKSTKSGTTYQLINEDASSNTKCIARERTSTSTSVLFIELALNSDIDISSLPQVKINTGFIEDVKLFSVNEIDYWIIAQYFDAARDSHDAPTLVYEVIGPGEVKLVQEIESHGAKRLSIDKVDNRWILGVVNTQPDADTPEAACHIHSAIYFWDEKEREFVLIRNVETENPTDIVSTTVVTGAGAFAENFITFSEMRSTDIEQEHIGKISIYRFERERLSYTLYQVIDTTHPVKSLSALNAREFTYIVTVCEEGLKFYKFLHAEGFRQDLSVPVTGALDANGIVWKNRIIFPIAGSKSMLAKGKFSGKITSLS